MLHLLCARCTDQARRAQRSGVSFAGRSARAHSSKIPLTALWSYEYKDYRVNSEQRYSGKGGAIAKNDLRAALDKLGIGLPDAANFVTVDEGAGRYAFRAECVVEDDMLTNGELACRVTEEGILYQEDNFLSVSTLCGNAMVFAPSIGEKCFVEKREQKQERSCSS